MSYTALYRKFRPSTFDEIKEQQHIVTTLKNQIENDRIGHAYLFCGTHGTGKTSIAKIFARAINCEHKRGANPCNECAMCKAALSGASMNVIEIDAASNNGVDSIREIRDEIQYSPTEGKYKVYIIDEVHMLSIGAFNALLKTLEEPPSYVIFILATTEAHKIPITILSRCQRYDFKRISLEAIAQHLRELLEKEGVEAEEKALRYIAKAADGSDRDALSLLDQCLAFHMNQTLTYDKVLEVLGAVDTEIFSQLLRRIIAQDTLGVIQELDGLIMSGRDLGQFTVDFTWYMRNLLLVQAADNVEELLDVSKEGRKALQEEANMLEPGVLMRYIRIFSELTGKLKYSAQKRVLTELALIKLTKPEMERDTEALLNRVANIEKMLESGVFVNQHISEVKMETMFERPEEEMMESLPPAQSADIKRALEAMPEIIRQARYPLKGYLRQCRYREGGEGRFIITTTDEIAHGYLADERNRSEIESLVSEAIQKELSVEVKLIQEAQDGRSDFLAAQSQIHMEISEEE